jgi:hypothetical protein
MDEPHARKLACVVLTEGENKNPNGFFDVQNFASETQ